METALKYIYYDMGTGRGQEGFQLLQQAVQDGDADACCLLARCLYGPEYTWPGHGFPVDDRTGDELMRRSVLGGSAIGVLLSLRSGVMDRRLAQAMPFGGLQDAFDLVLDKAEHGEPFCIYRENHAEAFALYRRSAKLGEPRAFFRAGLSYELGEGTAKDVRQAAEYYQQALAAPVYASRDGTANRLGAFYFNGEGCPRTLPRAWSTSGRPATMRRPGRSCGTTKRPFSASGCGGKGFWPHPVEAGQRGGGSTAGLQVKMSAGKSAEALPYGSASALFSLCRAQNRPADIKNEGGETHPPAD